MIIQLQQGREILGFKVKSSRITGGEVATRESYRGSVSKFVVTNKITGVDTGRIYLEKKRRKERKEGVKS